MAQRMHPLLAALLAGRLPSGGRMTHDDDEDDGDGAAAGSPFPSGTLRAWACRREFVMRKTSSEGSRRDLRSGSELSAFIRTAGLPSEGRAASITRCVMSAPIGVHQSGHGHGLSQPTRVRLNAAHLPTQIRWRVGSDRERHYNVLFSSDGGLLFSSGQDESITIMDATTLPGIRTNRCTAELGGSARQLCIPARNITWAISSLDVASDTLVYSTLNSTLHVVGLRSVRELIQQQGRGDAEEGAPDDGPADDSYDLDEIVPGDESAPAATSPAPHRPFNVSPASQPIPRASSATASTGGAPPSVAHTPIDLAGEQDGVATARSRFGVYQARFGGGGTEVVAGCSDHSIVVADVETRTVTARVTGHCDDINAVAFLDQRLQSNVLLSGSDDCTIRLWDRRTMGRGSSGSSLSEGYLLGHVEGVTSLDARNDGVYVASNAKDCTCKVWDVRRMSSSCGDAAHTAAMRTHSSGYDYRWQRYPRLDSPPHTRCHPGDASVATFRGHVVHKTLIRAAWSPWESTGAAFIASGSADGRVYIFDALAPDGEVHSVLPGHTDIVRQAAWHPYLPVLATASWDGTIGISDRGSPEDVHKAGRQRARRREVKAALDGHVARQSAAASPGDSKGAPGRLFLDALGLAALEALVAKDEDGLGSGEADAAGDEDDDASDDEDEEFDEEGQDGEQFFDEDEDDDDEDADEDA